MKRYCLLLLLPFLLASCTDSDFFIKSEPLPSVIDTSITGPAIEPISGGTCTAHTMDYHTFPTELIASIGDTFYDWFSAADGVDRTDECPYGKCNIAACLEAFMIPEEVFTELYYTEWYYIYLYDPAILYSGDSAAIEAYFRKDSADSNEDSTAKRELAQRNILCSAKIYLKATLKERSVSRSIIDKYDALSLTMWTFPELLTDAGFSMEDFLSILDEYSEQVKNALDADAIYAEAESMGWASVHGSTLDLCRYNIEYEKQFLNIQ